MEVKWVLVQVNQRMS